MAKDLTLKEKELLKKYDFNKKTKPKNEFASKKEMYLKQTDINYKDGDRN